MVELKNIGVLSSAKISAVLGLIGGIIAAVILLLVLAVLPATAISKVGSLPVYGFFSGLGLLLLIVLPLIFLVAGFIFGALVAWIYNIFAKRIGGVQFSLKNNVLTSVDPISAAKIIAVAFLVIGIIVCVVVSLVLVFVSGATALLILVLRIIEILVISAVYFAAVAIIALLYNFLANRMGGVLVNIKGGELVSVGVLSYAKINAVISAIIGFIYGAIFSVIFLVALAAPSGSFAGMGLFTKLGEFAIILFPLIYLVLGFVGGAINVWLYNQTAARIRGIKIKLSGK